jgi:hypothetical protein
VGRQNSIRGHHNYHDGSYFFLSANPSSIRVLRRHCGFLLAFRDAAILALSSRLLSGVQQAFHRTQIPASTVLFASVNDAMHAVMEIALAFCLTSS